MSPVPATVTLSPVLNCSTNRGDVALVDPPGAVTIRVSSTSGASGLKPPDTRAGCGRTRASSGISVPGGTRSCTGTRGRAGCCSDSESDAMLRRSGCTRRGDGSGKAVSTRTVGCAPVSNASIAADFATWPHSPQKISVCDIRAPQDSHEACGAARPTARPHSPQNRAPDGRSAPQ